MECLLGVGESQFNLLVYILRHTPILPEATLTQSHDQRGIWGQDDGLAEFQIVAKFGEETWMVERLDAVGGKIVRDFGASIKV